MTIKFVTALGNASLSEETFYRGLVQHVKSRGAGRVDRGQRTADEGHVFVRRRMSFVRGFALAAWQPHSGTQALAEEDGG